MGITIPEHEMDLCKTLGRPTWEALVLTNDLYSWEKERDDAARAGHAEVVNAVWVIMKEHSVSEPEAKKICELKIKESVAQALQVADKTKRDRSLSPDLRKYTEAMLYSISGNLVWSIYCPRYHPDQARPRVERARRSEASLASRPSTAMAAGL
jgi:fusicocca-2,10(14)-diene synthase